jgi:phosphoribosylpyrophosphate synthetase
MNNMKVPIIFIYTDYEYISRRIITNTNFMPDDVVIQKFPDKEDYLKLNSSAY